MILASTKWGPQLYETAVGLLRERVEQGFWYAGEDAERAEAILAMPLPKCIGPLADQHRAKQENAAWAFLVERDEHEYEGVEKVKAGP